MKIHLLFGLIIATSSSCSTEDIHRRQDAMTGMHANLNDRYEIREKAEADRDKAEFDRLRAR